MRMGVRGGGTDEDADLSLEQLVALRVGRLGPIQVRSDRCEDAVGERSQGFSDEHDAEDLRREVETVRAVRSKIELRADGDLLQRS